MIYLPLPRIADPDEARTLAELHEYHDYCHGGFAWQCPHCRGAWLRLRETDAA